jgi:membrane protease YdiL (CAAX protease family)
MTNTAENDIRPHLDLPVVVFFLLAYVLAWSSLAAATWVARGSGIESGIALLAMAESLDFQGHETDLTVPIWILYLLSRLADFSFTISGVVMVAYTAGRAGLSTLFRKLIQWRLPLRWYAVGLVPFLLYGLAAALTASGDANIRESFAFTPAAFRTILISVHAGFLVTLFLRGPMGEELGLRGFALTRLQRQYSPAKASLLIGVAWAGWHLPVLVGRGPIQVVVVILMMILLSFVFTWIYNSTNGSLLPVLLFHASQNSEEMLEVVMPGLVDSGWELTSFIGTLVFALVVTAHVIRDSRSSDSGARQS